MSIDWEAFVIVALVSLVSAAALVSVYALGLRLLAVSPDETPSAAARAGATACFVVCGLGVLFGIYLIVPAFHGG